MDSDGSDLNPTATLAARIAGLASDGKHRFSKSQRESLVLLKGIGVEGDAHAAQELSRSIQLRSSCHSARQRLGHVPFFGDIHRAACTSASTHRFHVTLEPRNFAYLPRAFGSRVLFATRCLGVQ